MAVASSNSAIYTGRLWIWTVICTAICSEPCRPLLWELFRCSFLNLTFQAFNGNFHTKKWTQPKEKKKEGTEGGKSLGVSREVRDPGGPAHDAMDIQLQSAPAKVPIMMMPAYRVNQHPASVVIGAGVVNSYNLDRATLSTPGFTLPDRKRFKNTHRKPATMIG